MSKVLTIAVLVCHLFNPGIIVFGKFNIIDLIELLLNEFFGKLTVVQLLLGNLIET